MFGVELCRTCQQDFLPRIWDGLLVSANYTHIDSEAEVPSRDSPIPLPLQ